MSTLVRRRAHRATGGRVAAALVDLAGGVSTAALTAVCGLGLWSVAPVALGWQAHVVMSASMEPTVSAGDVVLTAPVGTVAPVAGHVVVFEAADRGGTVVHRVRKVFDDASLQTKGDANPTADVAPVRPEDVVGVARLLVPGVGLPVVWLADQRWLLLGGTAVAGVLAVGALTLPSDQVTQPRTTTTGPGAPRARPRRHR